MKTTSLVASWESAGHFEQSRGARLAARRNSGALTFAFSSTVKRGFCMSRINLLLFLACKNYKVFFGVCQASKSVARGKVFPSISPPSPKIRAACCLCMRWGSSFDCQPLKGLRAAVFRFARLIAALVFAPLFHFSSVTIPKASTKDAPTM